MARLARVVALEVAHHVTQRGNARQFILNSDADREVYLELLRKNIAQQDVALLGYCLMSNHVHMVMIPGRGNSLAMTLKHTHGRYAAYWNAKHGSSGHVWQGRYYSCPLDSRHLWHALRYTELNPVRAGVVVEAAAWKSSSAAAHCGEAPFEEWLATEAWAGHWNIRTWREYLSCGESEQDLIAVRQATHTGRPLSNEEFVRDLEEKTSRCLTPRKGGRPVTLLKGNGQTELPFESSGAEE